MGNPTNPNRVVRVKDLDRFKVKNDGLYATLTAMAQAVADVTPDYIDIEDLEVGMTFPKNALLAINGVSYQAKKATTQFPVTVLVESGHIVYDEDENGRKALVVEDYTLASDWKIWGDAGIPRTIEQFKSDVNDEVDDFETQMTGEMSTFKAQVNTIVGQSIKPGTKITATSGTQYTVEAILTAMADLMESTIVVHE